MAPRTRLLWRADALLALVARLRVTGFIGDLAKVREKLAGLLADFQSAARADGNDAASVAQATDILAALIDHVVTSMPWGAEAGWQSIGSKQRLPDAAPGAFAAAGVRELYDVAQALGSDAAPPLLRAPGGLGGHAVVRPLSPDGASAVASGQSLTSWLPLWVSSAVVAALLALLFFGLELSLGMKSDALFARMSATRGPAVAVATPVPAPRPRLAASLSVPIGERSLAVRDDVDRSVIAVPESGLFDAGEAKLLPAGTELLRTVAAALQATPGRIQVIGHTDGVQVHSARYPSDWDLSVDRARTVEAALQGWGIEAARLTVDGRAGIEPLAAGDPLRAAVGNGRVEIVLLAGR